MSHVTPAQTLKNLYSTQYEPIKLGGGAAKTRRQYLMQIKTFASFLGREPTVQDLEDDTLARLMAWYEGRGRSPATVNKVRTHIVALWRFAAQRNLVPTWPTIPPRGEPLRVPEAWTLGEMERLFAACDRMPGMVGRVKAALWWHAIHLVAWDTCERVGALLSTPWRDFHPREGWLLIRAQYRKGNKSDRLYRLHPQTIGWVERLKTHLVQYDDSIFRWPYSESLLYKKYDQLLKLAELPLGSRQKFHKMRRSGASYATAQGDNATELLDHSNRQVTRLYLDPRITGGNIPAHLQLRPDAKGEGGKVGEDGQDRPDGVPK